MDKKIVIFVKLCSLLIETNVNKKITTTQHNKKIGHFHYDDIWLIKEFISFLLSYFNLSISLKFKKQ